MKNRFIKIISVILCLVLSLSLAIGMSGCKDNETSDNNDNKVVKEPVVLAENETALYVSPDGNDEENDGSFEKPFKTFAAAQKKYRDMTVQMKGNIYVIFREGSYAEKIALYQTDSGENGFKVVLKAYPGENAEIYGGKKLDGFTKVEGTNLYKTTVSDMEAVRQFYVNGVAQPRSTSTTRVLPSDWLNGSEAKDGFLIKTEYLGGINYTDGLEIRLSYQWQDIIIPVKGIRKGSDSMSMIYMADAPKKLYTNMTGTATELSSGLTLEFFLENSVELIDEPGEWSYDTESKELYYYPTDDVDMTSAVFEVPEKTELLTVEGLDGTLKAHDIAIEGLTFRMGAWNVPSELGFVSWQSDAYWEKVIVYPEVTYNQMSGNIRLKYCNNISFKNNTVTAAGCTALTMPEGVSNTEIVGNAFTHCAAGAMTVGNYRQGTALHTDTSNQLCDGITVSDNTIYKMGESYYAVVGIGVYYGRNVTLSHNDILYTPNSGISVGWGWNPAVETTTESIKILNNIISFHGMKSRDSGGIYTLGKQKNCVIEENYIKDNGFSEKGIYHDQGTGGYTNSRNVLDMQQASYWTNDYHKNTLSMTYNDNYTSTNRHINRTNSVHNNTTYVLDRNWPTAARKIIFSAGNEAAFGSVRAKAYGINSENLGLWLSADSGIVLDDSGKITAWNDYSGNLRNAAVNSGEAVWSSYVSNENHAVKLAGDVSFKVADFGTADAVSLAFVADFDKDENVKDILLTVGAPAVSEPDKLNDVSFDGIGSYVYTTDGKKGLLYKDSVLVAEWSKNAPKLANELIIGNDEALLFELMCFNDEISDNEIADIFEYFTDKYSIALPTSENLVLWLDAGKLVTADENGQVSAWGDSGDRRLGGLVQQNKDYMPKYVSDGINGKPAILFDGKDDSLWNFSSRWVGEEATVFVVMELDSKETQSFGSVNGIKEFLTEIKKDGSISTGDNIPDRITTDAGAFSFGKTQCLTYQRYPLFEEITPQDEVWLSAMPGVIKLYNGDTKIGEYSHNTKHADTEWGGFMLGTNDETTLSGKVAEVLIYDRLLTDTERAGVTEYLRAKYNF